MQYDISFVNFDKQYIQAYQQLFKNNIQLLKETKTDHELTLEEVQQVQLMYNTEKNKYCFLIIETNSNRLIGDINLLQFGNMQQDEIEISIMIAYDKDRRKGYGQKALQYAEDFVKQKNFKKLIAQIDIENLISQKFFEKNNYKKIKENKEFNEYIYEKVLNQLRRNIIQQ